MGQYLTFEYLKAQQSNFQEFYEQKTDFLTIGVYFGVYILVTALSLPGATILTLAAGALFGLWAGVGHRPHLPARLAPLAPF